MQIETLDYTININKKVKGSGKYVDVLNDFYDNEDQKTLILKCKSQKEKNTVQTALRKIKESQNIDYVIWSKRTSFDIYVIKS